MQKGLANIWKEIGGVSSVVHVMATIEDGVDFVQDLAEDGPVHTFATGSFRLIGGIISILAGIQTPTPPVSQVSPVSLDAIRS